MKTYKELVEEIANSVGSGNVAGISPGDHPVVRRKVKPKSKFMGCPVFEVSSEEYQKCLHGKGKRERYARYFADEDKVYGIKNQVKKSGASSIIIQNKLTGEMSYLIRR
tara:strand:- start:1271 stop:1597 length:327 start_codon:yes stop_codon:yes gene_type:complete